MQKINPVVKAMIIEAKNKAAREASEEAFVLLLGLPLMVLRDKHNFGKKRLEQFENDILDIYDSFQKGLITLEDVITTIEAETGMKLEKRG